MYLWYACLSELSMYLWYACFSGWSMYHGKRGSVNGPCIYGTHVPVVGRCI